MNYMKVFFLKIVNFETNDPKNKIVKINVLQFIYSITFIFSTLYYTHCLVGSIYDTDLEKKLIKSRQY